MMQPRRSPPLAVLLLAACLSAACATRPARTAAEQQADAALATQVEAALNADSRLFARHIDVSAEDGKVLLGGYVWSPEDFYRAPQIARAVPGVTDVVTQMELLRGGRGGGGR